MNTLASGPAWSFQAGQVLEVGKDIEEKVAMAFVAGNYATPVVEKRVEKAVQPTHEARSGSNPPPPAGEKPSPPANPPTPAPPLPKKKTRRG